MRKRVLGGLFDDVARACTLLGGYSQHMQHESCIVEDSNHIAVKKLAVFVSARDKVIHFHQAGTMPRRPLCPETN